MIEVIFFDLTVSFGLVLVSDFSFVYFSLVSSFG